MKRINFVSFILVFLLIFSLLLYMPVSKVEAQTGQTMNPVYLPLIMSGYSNSYNADSKFLGIYMDQYWTDNSVNTYMTQADNLAGKKHTVSGWFISFQNIAFTSRQSNTQNNFYTQLEALWKNGYYSFVNITSASSLTSYEVTDNCPIPFNAYQVARGDCDRAIRRMADLYKLWIGLGGQRKAFIAPLPEMNGVYSDGSKWTSYGGDPQNFKLAYQRIRSIFNQQGVADHQVWWVYAPNGWHDENFQPQHAFEYYYPGDQVTDAVAFSSYNYGYCHVAFPWQRWDTYDVVYEPYLVRMKAMAPSKPIIIAQTGTTAEYQYPGELNIRMKNSWLIDNYNYLAQQPQVLGIIYFDINLAPGECNWSISSGGNFTGYGDGAANPVFQYLDPANMETLVP